MRILMIALIWIFLSQTAHAQSYQINIHGTPFSCTAYNGQPVAIYTDHAAASSAAQLGGARVDIDPVYGYKMALNTSMLSNTPALSAVLVFFHECGHAALHPSYGMQPPYAQQHADCWAIKQMVNLGFIKNWTDFNVAVTYLYQIGGMHSITQLRIQAMASCL